MELPHRRVEDQLDSGTISPGERFRRIEERQARTERLVLVQLLVLVILVVLLIRSDPQLIDPLLRAAGG